jgi:nicotinamidase/pyrazinamidase
MDPEEDAYSAFQAGDPQGRAFADVLEERGVRRLFVGGLATDYCVKESALDARRHGFDVVVLTDASRAVDVNPGDGERALQAMREAGARMLTLAEL